MFGKLGKGCKELDIVMNFSALKSGHLPYVREELLAIGRNTEGFVRKVIIIGTSATFDILSYGHLLAS